MPQLSFCPSVVIFDMDGLLVDSEPVWALVEEAMMVRRGKTLDQETRARFIGMRMADFWGGMVTAYQFTEPPQVFIDEAVQTMVERIPLECKPMAGVNELLHFLHEHDIPCALASSSPRAIIDAVVESQGWRNNFELFVSGDEVAEGKPAPDIFLETATRMKVNPAECLVLEDSRNGARAAVAAGMVCYAVPDPSHNTPDAFAQITPHVFASLHEVKQALDMCYNR